MKGVPPPEQATSGGHRPASNESSTLLLVASSHFPRDEPSKAGKSVGAAPRSPRRRMIGDRPCSFVALSLVLSRLRIFAPCSVVRLALFVCESACPPNLSHRRHRCLFWRNKLQSPENIAARSSSHAGQVGSCCDAAGPKVN